MNLSAPFIRRPIATMLLTIGIALAGIAAFFSLPVAPLPQVDFPVISVSASLAGASPDVMAQIRVLRRHGVPLVQPPDNYYDDLAARFDLSEAWRRELREHGVFYDREEGADDSPVRELLHAYTDVLAVGFYVELV